MDTCRQFAGCALCSYSPQGRGCRKAVETARTTSRRERLSSPVLQALARKACRTGCLPLALEALKSIELRRHARRLIYTFADGTTYPQPKAGRSSRG